MRKALPIAWLLAVYLCIASHAGAMPRSLQPPRELPTASKEHEFHDPLPSGYKAILMVGMSWDLEVGRVFDPVYGESYDRIVAARPHALTAVRQLVPVTRQIYKMEKGSVLIRFLRNGAVVDSDHATLLSRHASVRSRQVTLQVATSFTAADTIELLYEGQKVLLARIETANEGCAEGQEICANQGAMLGRVVTISSEPNQRCNQFDGSPLVGRFLDPDCAANPQLLCNNGRLNLGEQGVDCGGGCPRLCDRSAP